VDGHDFTAAMDVAGLASVIAKASTDKTQPTITVFMTSKSGKTVSRPLGVHMDKPDEQVLKKLNLSDPDKKNFNSPLITRRSGPCLAITFGKRAGSKD
jgi:hypothetical protein